MVERASLVEYYLVTHEGHFKFNWPDRDPSFIMLAPLHEALLELGAFNADAEAAWPGNAGEPYFLIGAEIAPELLEVFEATDWTDYLTPGRIRDVIGVSDKHAEEMVDLAVNETIRLTELLRAATERGAGLLCVVF